MKISTRTVIERVLIYGALGLLSLVILFPILVMIQASFKVNIDITSVPPRFLFRPTLRHYTVGIVERSFLVYFLNSLAVTLGTIAVVLSFGALAAFGLAAYQYKAKSNLSFTILSMRMLPRICVVLPFFLLIYRLGLFNTRLGLIVVYTVFNLPFTIYILEGFFSELPIELKDSAMIDGCTDFQVYRKIFLPLGKPGLVATASFCFIFSWNEFMFALVLTSNESAMTAPVQIASVLSLYGVDWGDLSAVGVIAIVPAVLFLFFLQKYMVRGLTMGALKE